MQVVGIGQTALHCPQATSELVFVQGQADMGVGKAERGGTFDGYWQVDQESGREKGEGKTRKQELREKANGRTTR